MAKAVRRMKVLILPSWYPTERYPVGGVFIQEQGRALAQHADVEVSVLFVDRASLGEWLRSSKGLVCGNEHGVPVFRIVMPRLPMVWPFLYTFWALFAYAYLYRRDRQPDLVHAHVALPAGLAGVLLKRVWGRPLVISEHTAPFSYLMRNPLAALATRVALVKATRVIAVGTNLRQQIQSYPYLRRPIDIVPNVVNVAAFLERRVERSPGAPYRLLFVGEMQTSRKGVDYLIGAVSILRRRGLYVTLDLVGEGQHKRDYEAMSRRLHVADVCKFHGMLLHAQVVDLMPQFELFVLPSLAETFGVVLVEALASGMPVVSTRSGGPDDIVTPDLGVLVEPANSAALADGISDVLARLEHFPPEHLRTVAEHRYGQASVARQLVKLYHQVIAKKAKS